MNANNLAELPPVRFSPLTPDPGIRCVVSAKDQNASSRLIFNKTQELSTLTLAIDSTMVLRQSILTFLLKTLWKALSPMSLHLEDYLCNQKT